ncbi:hypothetical protein [Kitasatospora fiedleri]|uniref:hypothetical protein n=1 Tax=Kitasatospora fiedleri TaxID=2991545 RepID=UPI00249BB7DC|nr:hypothetical protein [Kitasatospora fiedleri]
MPLQQHQRSLRRGAFALLPAVLLATALAACSSDGGDTMPSWSKDGGQEQIRVIGEDLTVLLNADATSADSTEHCQQVLDDIKRARDHRAIPDATAQTYWQQALDQMETAATHCTRNTGALTGGAKLSEVIPAQESYHLLVGRISDLAAGTP